MRNERENILKMFQTLFFSSKFQENLKHKPTYTYIIC